MPASALAELMRDDKFPRRLLSEILQQKMKWKLSPEAGKECQGEEAPPPGTPSDEKKNEEAGELIAATKAAVQGANAPGGSEQDADLGDDGFADLPGGGSGKDWSANCDSSTETWLQNHAKERCESWTAGAIAQQPLFLFKEEKHRPANARGFTQKFLVAIALVVHKKRMPLLGPEDAEAAGAPPPAQPHVQGNPGTSKSFAVHTAGSIARSLAKVMGCGCSAAPAGCTACLINGETNPRAFKRLRGKQQHKTVSAERIRGAVEAAKSHCGEAASSLSSGQPNQQQALHHSQRPHRPSSAGLWEQRQVSSLPNLCSQSQRHHRPSSTQAQAQVQAWLSLRGLWSWFSWKAWQQQHHHHSSSVWQQQRRQQLCGSFWSHACCGECQLRSVSAAQRMAARDNRRRCSAAQKLVRACAPKFVPSFMHRLMPDCVPSFAQNFAQSFAQNSPPDLRSWRAACATAAGRKLTFSSSPVAFFFCSFFSLLGSSMGASADALEPFLGAMMRKSQSKKGSNCLCCSSSEKWKGLLRGRRARVCDDTA
jgi:hypothetical protein